jgi:hypothetical protein
MGQANENAPCQNPCFAKSLAWQSNVALLNFWPPPTLCGLDIFGCYGLVNIYSPHSTNNPSRSPRSYLSIMAANTKDTLSPFISWTTSPPRDSVSTHTQKGISGDIVLHGDTTDPFASPRLALIRQVKHLRQHTTDPDTPLYRFYDKHDQPRRITDHLLTSSLRMCAALLQLDVDTTVGALRCTGATAALEGDVPVSLIKLLGRWRSDEVFRYLHLQSETLMAPVATHMLN